jgi:hypothetical protein
MTTLQILFVSALLFSWLISRASMADASDDNPARKLLNEELLSLAQAARIFPSDREGSHASPVSLWRWCKKGIKLGDGSTLRLEHIRVCGRILVSRESVFRFVSKQNPEVSAPQAPEKKSANKPTKRSQAADEKLKKKGA